MEFVLVSLYLLNCCEIHSINYICLSWRSLFFRRLWTRIWTECSKLNHISVSLCHMSVIKAIELNILVQKYQYLYNVRSKYESNGLKKRLILCIIASKSKGSIFLSFVFSFNVGIEMWFLSKSFTTKSTSMWPFLLMNCLNMNSYTFLGTKTFFAQGAFNFLSSMNRFDMFFKGCWHFVTSVTLWTLKRFFSIQFMHSFDVKIQVTLI